MVDLVRSLSQNVTVVRKLDLKSQVATEVQAKKIECVTWRLRRVLKLSFGNTVVRHTEFTLRRSRVDNRAWPGTLYVEAPR